MNFSSKNIHNNYLKDRNKHSKDSQYISAKQISLELLNDIDIYIKKNLDEEFSCKVE